MTRGRRCHGASWRVMARHGESWREARVASADEPALGRQPHSRSCTSATHSWHGSVRGRAQGWRRPTSPNTENTIDATMARAIDNLQPGRWHNEDTIGYPRTTSGKEARLLFFSA